MSMAMKQETEKKMEMKQNKLLEINYSWLNPSFKCLEKGLPGKYSQKPGNSEKKD